MSQSFNSVKHALAFLSRHGQIESVEDATLYLKRGAVDPDDERVCNLLDDAYEMVRESGYQITIKRPPHEMMVDEIEAPMPIPASALTPPIMGVMSSVPYPITNTIDTESDQSQDVWCARKAGKIVYVSYDSEGVRTEWTGDSD